MVEICRRLDGIPLAIELAASRMASMTASEVRDRLDHRFRLLVGSRRGLARHQTLRHAVAWSYDLLDESEKALLDRCSVFAGGFDLEAPARWPDPMTPTTTRSSIYWTRWCASRCWSPTGHLGGPGFRCWRRSASSPRSNSSRQRRSHRGAYRARPPLRRPRSRRPGAVGQPPTAARPTTGSPPSWPICAPRSDGRPTTATSTWPPSSLPTRRCLGHGIDNYEPVAWAEELIEPARAVDHPRLAALYVMASQCYTSGRDRRGSSVLRGRAGRSRQEPRCACHTSVEGMLGGRIHVRRPA